jgi:hypothetical protein
LLHICARYTRTRRREVEKQAEQKNAKKKEKRKKMDWAADPPPSWAVFPRQPNDLNHYQVGDLVFCKATPKAIEPFWPGKLIDPIEAPSAVRASCVPDAVCVMFYGPATIKKHDRDYCWAVKEQLAPFDEENARTCKTQALPKRMRPRAFETAVEEIEGVFKQFGTARLGYVEGVVTHHLDDAEEEEEERGVDDTDEDDTDDEEYDGAGDGKKKNNEKRASTTTQKRKASGVAASTSNHKNKKPTKLMKNGLQCASCGVSCARKELDAKQFCLLCAKMHGEGQYCPCCGKVWHYANCGPMIQCDTCEMWVHDLCDATAAEILKKEAEALKEGREEEEIPYNCPTCAAGKIDEEAMKIKAARQAREAEMERKKILSQIPKLPKALAKVKEDIMIHVDDVGVSGNHIDMFHQSDAGTGDIHTNVIVDSKNKSTHNEGIATAENLNMFSPPPSRDAAKLSTDINNKISSPPSATKVGKLPSRPKTAWQLFGAEFSAKYKAENNLEQISNHAEVYRLQGMAWQKLSDAEKQKYEAQASEAAIRFRNALLKMQKNGTLQARLAKSIPSVDAREQEKKLMLQQQKRQNKTHAEKIIAANIKKVEKELNELEEDNDEVTELEEDVAKKKTAKLAEKDDTEDANLRIILAAKEAQRAAERRVGLSGVPFAEFTRKSRVDWSLVPKDLSERPERVQVVCNGVKGDFLTQEYRVVCLCTTCQGKEGSLTATEFEKHAGMGQAKKWKASLRMVVPERMPVGRWLDGAPTKKYKERTEKKEKFSKVEPEKNRKVVEEDQEIGEYKSIYIAWAVDRCAVCDDERDFDFDQLITCEGCQVSVHQSCYGVHEIPDQAVGWLCRACEHTGGVVSETPKCCLCPVLGGALKPTTVDGIWAHSACCQWIPETTVLDIETMEPIDNIAAIQRERWELLCTICKQRCGTKVQCCHPGCFLAYHPLCARGAGLFMDQGDEYGNADDDPEDDTLHLISYCHRHCRVDKERQKMFGCVEGMRHGEEGNDGVIVSGPWIQTKASKRVQRVLDAEEEKRKKREKRELEKMMNNSDSDLSDSEGDGLCAKLRPYVPKGHPRTEADIDDGDGDGIKPKIRKRLIHDDSDDERVFGGKDSEDEDSDEDNDAQKEIEERQKNERELQLEEEQRAIQKRREERDQEKRRKIAEKLAKAAVTEPKAEAEPDDINAPPVLPGGLPLPQDNVGDPNSPNISVSCKTTIGTFRPADTYIKCHCARCANLVKDVGKDAPALWEANRWEYHCGMGHAKKWRISIKILPEGGNPSGRERVGYETFGSYLDKNPQITVLSRAGRPLPKGKGLKHVNLERDPSLPPLPKRKPVYPAGQLALKNLEIDLDNVGKVDDKKMTIEEKAKNLEGKRIAIDASTATFKESVFVKATIIEAVVTRTGCRHRLNFDDEDGLKAIKTDMLSLNDPKFAIKWLNVETDETLHHDEWPDLSFLPKVAATKDEDYTQERAHALAATARKPGPRRPSKPLDPSKFKSIFDDDDEESDDEDRECEAWVQCENDDCRKWRRVPQSIAEALAKDDADVWTCERNPEPRFADCEIEQEFLDDEIDRRIELKKPKFMGDDDVVYEKAKAEKRLKREQRKELLQNSSKMKDLGEKVAEDDDDSWHPELPVEVSIVCRNVPGEYNTRKSIIRCLCEKCQPTPDAPPVYHDPKNYEDHAGMPFSKKWRVSVRVCVVGGALMPLGKWLEGFGVRLSKKKKKKNKKADLNQPYGMKKFGQGLTPAQLREIQLNVYKRLGVQPPKSSDLLKAKNLGPPPKTGKRQYVGLQPYIVRGTRGGLHRALVTSRSYTPEEWQEKYKKMQAAKNLGCAPDAANKGLLEGTGLSLKERILECTNTVKKRLTFGKSAIHGWGLISKVPIKAGAMVIIYRGEAVRTPIADLREARYERDGTDCYLLRADDHTVVDCTNMGNIARFTNHSCDPNMYTKIIKSGGEHHVCFFARIDVPAGTEMTYNYRFEIEDGKVPCYCASQNCRGYLA